jgi:hypothetical protein
LINFHQQRTVATVPHHSPVSSVSIVREKQEEIGTVDTKAAGNVAKIEGETL